MAVDNQAGADIGRGIDVRAERRMLRQLAGGVMVEILDGCTPMQRPRHGGGIAAQRNIENGQAVARLRIDACHQPDVAFDAGDQLGVAGFIQPQLVQRADAVGVAVEDVVEFHE